MGFAPLRIVATAVLSGGADDFEDFYCPTVEWEWGDGTRSESKVDCDPYEPGKSEIKRSYSLDHRFEWGGEFRVQFRLKPPQPGGNRPPPLRVSGALEPDAASFRQGE